jgi:hypothetical protein
LAARWRQRAPILCVLALLSAAGGLSADLAAETILAVFSQSSRETYALVESIAVALTGYVGNALYAVAVILLTWSGRRELPPGLLGWRRRCGPPPFGSRMAARALANARIADHSCVVVCNAAESPQEWAFAYLRAVK